MKLRVLLMALMVSIGVTTVSMAAKVPAPAQGGDSFMAVTLSEAKRLHEDGATFVACHSHTTDFMKGHPTGTVHITCLVPKDHKRTDMALENVIFDVAALPSDKTATIVMYCASSS
ncbi:MAG: hypothetical protein GY702_11980 [Desulfobulbaceae bacterium]|nr:hypothetical protein [Desulfobulbaceae bacterium]